MRFAYCCRFRGTNIFTYRVNLVFLDHYLHSVVNKTWKLTHHLRKLRSSSLFNILGIYLAANSLFFNCNSGKVLQHLHFARHHSGKNTVNPWIGHLGADLSSELLHGGVFEGGLLQAGGGLAHFSGSWLYSIWICSTNKLHFDAANTSYNMFSKGHTIFRWLIGTFSFLTL